MNRPIRFSFIAALLLGTTGWGLGQDGIVVGMMRLFAVFFGCFFVLLMLLHLFYNRRWRISPGPMWHSADRRPPRRRLRHRGAW